MRVGRLLLYASAAGGLLLTSGCTLAGVIAAVVILTQGKSSGHGGGPPQPVVSSVTPSEGSHGGGTVITITGANFSSNATVLVGDIEASQVSVLSGSKIVATTPRSPVIGPVSVTVVDPQGGSGVLPNAFTYTNALPVATVTPIPSPQTGNMVVTFTLADLESDLADVAVAVDRGDGTFQPVPASQILGDLTGLDTSPAGVTHTIALDTRAIFGAVNLPAVRVRVTPSDETDQKPGTPGITPPFSILNNVPPVVQIIQPGNDAFDVAIKYIVSDPDPTDRLEVTGLTWQVLGAQARSGNMTVRSGQGLGPVAFSASGTLVTTVWDSLTDIGFGNNQLVTVTITVFDGFTSTTQTTLPFFVSNGPLADPVTFPIGGTLLDAMSVGDVTSEGRPDVVTASRGPAGTSGLVQILKNSGRTFDSPRIFMPPPIPGEFPGTPPPPDPNATNVFLTDQPHPAPNAILDVNGDGALDLVVGNDFNAPHSETPLTDPSSLAQTLFWAASDAPNGFRDVAAHQVTLIALQTDGFPNIEGGTWESSQAPFARLAPHVRFPGQSPSTFPPPSTGVPALDHIGWFAQDLEAADLDPPSGQGAGGVDLVILHGIARLDQALAPKPDLRGAIVIRMADPTTVPKNQLGPPIYLDPTDMGVLPTQVAIADVLSSSRAALLGPAAAAFGRKTALGSKDIVTVNTGESSLTFYYQVAPATFPPEAPFTVSAPLFASFKFPLQAVDPDIPPGDAAGIAFGDLNGDGANDFVVVGQLSKTAIIFLFDPNPAAPRSLVEATGGLLPYRVGGVLALPEIRCGVPAIGDVSNDGRADILIPSGITSELLVYVNEGNGTAPAGVGGTPSFDLVRFSAGFGAFQVILSDMNGDRLLDAAVANLLTESVGIYYQTTPGSLDERFVPVPTGQNPRLLAVGDVTGSGGPELVVPMAGENSLFVYRPDPVATLALVTSLSLVSPDPSVETSEPFAPVIADLTGDGKVDIAVSVQVAIDASGAHGGWEAVLANPLRPPVAAVFTGSFNSPALGMAVGDLNADGIPDVVLTGPLPGVMTIFSGTGALKYARSDRTGLVNAGQVEIADLDGDGHNDIVVARQNGVSIFYNGGDPRGSLPFGQFPLTPVTIETAPIVDPQALAVADVNNDGKKDIVLSSFTSASAAVLFQTGPRTYTAPIPLNAFGEPGQIAVGDLNGDGLPDIAIAFGSANAVGVYYQNPHATGFADALLPAVIYPTNENALGCAIMDVDGDGKNDLVVSAAGANALNVFFQR
jgi:hypothetical protein